MLLLLVFLKRLNFSIFYGDTDTNYLIVFSVSVIANTSMKITEYIFYVSLNILLNFRAVLEHLYWYIVIVLMMAYYKRSNLYPKNRVM